MRTAHKLLLNLPLIAIAAAWAPVAQLVLLAEQQATVHGQSAGHSRYQFVLAELPRALPTPESTSGQKQTETKAQHRQVRLLKPVTEHLDTASVVHLGAGDVPLQSVAFAFDTHTSTPAVRAATAQAALFMASQRARGPPVPQA